MSRHMFTAPNGIKVCMGWDRPMQGFFMTLEKPSAESEDQFDYIFNNMDQADPNPKSLTGYLDELSRRGIILPDYMVSELIADAEHNVGNKIVFHNP